MDPENPGALLPQLRGPGLALGSQEPLINVTSFTEDVQLITPNI